MIFLENVLIVLGFFALVVLMQIAIDRFLTPVSDRGCRTEVSVYASGGGDGLEQTVRAARRLAKRGGIAVTVYDDGLDSEGRAIAERLAYGGGFEIQERR